MKIKTNYKANNKHMLSVLFVMKPKKCYFV